MNNNQEAGWLAGRRPAHVYFRFEIAPFDAAGRREGAHVVHPGNEVDRNDVRPQVSGAEEASHLVRVVSPVERVALQRRDPARGKT